MKQYTKSETEILNAVDGVKRIPKHLKRHDKAIAALKAKGIIEIGVDDILRRVQVKYFESNERGFLTTAIRELMDKNVNNPAAWQLGSEVLRKIKLLS